MQFLQIDSSGAVLNTSAIKGFSVKDESVWAISGGIRYEVSPSCYRIVHTFLKGSFPYIDPDSVLMRRLRTKGKDTL